MGVERSEHVMMGLFLKKVPFDYYEDEYLRYIEGWEEETLSIVPISGLSDEGYVIGRILVRGDSNAGIALTNIEDYSIPTRAEIVKEILEKLKISATEGEIKLYIFSHWS